MGPDHWSEMVGDQERGSMLFDEIPVSLEFGGGQEGNLVFLNGGRRRFKGRQHGLADGTIVGQ